MQRVNLAKYGFVANPQGNFSDDGTRYTSWLLPGYPKVEVTKTIDKGTLYLSVHYEAEELPFEMYCRLPQYEKLRDLNGVTIQELSDEDLRIFVDDIKNFDKVYKDTVKETVYLSREQLRNKCLENLNLMLDASRKLESACTLNLLRHMSRYDREYVLDVYGRLLEKLQEDLSSKITSLLNNADGLIYMKRTLSPVPELIWSIIERAQEKIVAECGARRNPEEE